MPAADNFLVVMKIWDLNILILKFYFKDTNKACKQYHTVVSILHQHRRERLHSWGEQEAEEVG